MSGLFNDNCCNPCNPCEPPCCPNDCCGNGNDSWVWIIIVIAIVLLFCWRND